MNPNNDGGLVFLIFIKFYLLQSQGVKICTEVHFESGKLGPDHLKTFGHTSVVLYPALSFNPNISPTFNCKIT
jgi:hypothetical protein